MSTARARRSAGAAARDDLGAFRKYRATGDIALRNALVERHLPLARRLAARYARSGEMAEELRQVAALAVVKAVDRFDPSRGVRFSSFATPTIVGELKRHLRDNRWAAHVPRDLQELAQKVARANDSLTTQLGRAPTLRDVADAIGEDVEHVIEARAALGAIDASSLDVPVGAEGDAESSLAEMLGDVDRGYELVEEREAVATALARLTERQRVALRLRFADDMTQAEIGAVLGVSQMQVSRMLRGSLDSLRQMAGAAV